MPDPTGIELLPCPVPWCGSSNVKMMRGPAVFFVLCRDCGVESDGFGTATKAADQWNTRTPSESDELLGRLAAYLVEQDLLFQYSCVEEQQSFSVSHSYWSVPRSLHDDLRSALCPPRAARPGAG